MSVSRLFALMITGWPGSCGHPALREPRERSKFEIAVHLLLNASRFRCAVGSEAVRRAIVCRGPSVFPQSFEARPRGRWLRQVTVAPLTDRTAMHSGRSSRGRLECGRGGTVLVSAHFFSKSEDARLPVLSTCRTTAPGPERVTCATAVILKPAPRRAETVGDGRGAGGVARRRGVWAGRVAEGEKDAPCAGL